MVTRMGSRGRAYDREIQQLRGGLGAEPLMGKYGNRERKPPDKELRQTGAKPPIRKYRDQDGV